LLSLSPQIARGLVLTKETLVNPRKTGKVNSREQTRFQTDLPFHPSKGLRWTFRARHSIFSLLLSVGKAVCLFNLCPPAEDRYLT
jgi:hypothetical protein